MRAAAAAVLVGVVMAAGSGAQAASGQRAGCLVADLRFRRPAVLHISTMPNTWSVKGNSRFVLFDNLGSSIAVDEDTETWVTDTDGASLHQRQPLRDDTRAAKWMGAKILNEVPKISCQQGVGWLVVYKR